MTANEVKACIIRSLSRALSMAVEDAKPIAEAIIDDLAYGHGGDYVRVPVRSIDLVERNARIRDEFTGANFQQLADRYGVSVRTVYRVVAGKASGCMVAGN